MSKNTGLKTTSAVVAFNERITDVCGNCQTPLESNNRFCSDCGAKVIHNRLTLKHLFSEAKEGLLSLDSNRPLLTFIHLFTKPDIVIGGYIAGVRKRYINPFGYLTIAITLSSFFIFIAMLFYPEILDAISNVYNTNEAQRDTVTSVNRGMMEYQTLMFFLTIPFLALLSRIVFLKNKRYNYTEHLIVNMYTYSQVSIVSTLFYFSFMWSIDTFKLLATAQLPIWILFYGYVLKKLYNLSTLQVFLKTLLFIVVLIPFFILVSIGMGIFMFLNGDFKELIDIEKAKHAQEAVSYIASSVINCTS